MNYPRLFECRESGTTLKQHCVHWSRIESHVVMLTCSTLEMKYYVLIPDPCYYSNSTVLYKDL